MCLHGCNQPDPDWETLQDKQIFFNKQIASGGDLKI